MKKIASVTEKENKTKKKKKRFTIKNVALIRKETLWNKASKRFPFSSWRRQQSVTVRQIFEFQTLCSRWDKINTLSSNVWGQNVSTILSNVKSCLLQDWSNTARTEESFPRCQRLTAASEERRLRKVQQNTGRDHTGFREGDHRRGNILHFFSEPHSGLSASDGVHQVLEQQRFPL